MQCTFWFDGPWTPCCLAHDYACADAEAQQSWEMRLEGDKALKECVASYGYPWMAGMMYAGVRTWVYLKRFFTGRI